MAPDGPETGMQRRLTEMDERLRTIQAELSHDVGASERAVAGARPRRSRRAPRIFPPQQPVDPPVDPPVPPPSETGQPTREGTSERAITAGVAGQDAARLEAMCARLVRATRELLAGYELALGHVSSDAAGSAVTLAAGPFRGVAALEQFEATLLGLPDVAGVAVRGFEGSDRAILEVQLRG